MCCALSVRQLTRLVLAAAVGIDLCYLYVCQGEAGQRPTREDHQQLQQEIHVLVMVNLTYVYIGLVMSLASYEYRIYMAQLRTISGEIPVTKQLSHTTKRRKTKEYN